MTFFPQFSAVNQQFSAVNYSSSAVDFFVTAVTLIFSAVTKYLIISYFYFNKKASAVLPQCFRSKIFFVIILLSVYYKNLLRKKSKFRETFFSGKIFYHAIFIKIY